MTENNSKNEYYSKYYFAHKFISLLLVEIEKRAKQIETSQERKTQAGEYFESELYYYPLFHEFSIDEVSLKMIFKKDNEFIERVIGFAVLKNPRFDISGCIVEILQSLKTKNRTFIDRSMLLGEELRSS